MKNLKLKILGQTNVEMKSFKIIGKSGLSKFYGELCKLFKNIAKKL